MEKKEKYKVEYFFNTNGKSLEELLEKVFKNYILNKVKNHLV